MAKKKEVKAGRVDMSAMRAMINKKAGRNVAHDLREDNPTEVKQWIQLCVRESMPASLSAK